MKYGGGGEEKKWSGVDALWGIVGHSRNAISSLMEFNKLLGVLIKVIYLR